MAERSAFGKAPEGLARLFAIGLQDPDTAQPASSTVFLGGFLERPGSRIGRYRLLGILGEGGMGIVYLAEQTEPLRREVALKVIKPGMDSKRVIARFEAEQQALALMEHPHIARVYDAGLAPSHRPYFVMERVRGIPITEHCDKCRLTIEERLRLFLHVCEAVQHAHQKGIIHRDLKPSNILVTVQNKEVIPKVIDFGVARAISQPLTERTLYTEQGQLIGTPEYISPEQADPNNQDIDTRTDVYSLGVVLYELLAGVLPFDARVFRAGGIEHIRKVICEQDAKPLSTRLSKTSVEESAESARRRRTDTRTLQGKLRGDLDWITLKAVEKDRTRRYPTVDALAADIRNHLDHQPVNAAPPGTFYRARKFARRHRQAISAIGAIIIVLIVALWAIQAHVQAGRERNERILAEARRLFETSGVHAQGAADSSKDALVMIQPLLAKRHIGPQVRLLHASILLEDRRYDEAVPQLKDLSLLQDRPEVAGAAHALLARIIWESQSLGAQEITEFEEHQEKAEQLLPRTADAYYLRAMTALPIDEKLDLLGLAIGLDRDHYPSRRLRALTYLASRRYEDLENDALMMTDRWPNDALGYSLRATAMKELGDYEEAVTYYDTAIRLTAADDPEYVALNGRCCEALMRMGQYERVLSKIRQCLRIAPEAAILHFHAFCALTALGRYEEANTLYRGIADSNPDARTRLRDWSMKYVFDTLEAGFTWHPTDSAPEGPVFLPMFIAEETYRELSAHAHRLFTDSFSGHWSQGGKLAFSMGVQGYSGVALYDVESREPNLLIVPGMDPRWSPDGRQIAFVRDCEVLRLSEFTQAERRFQRRAPEEEEVWVMNADGAEPRLLARGGWPSWSADGKRVYYQSRVDAMLYSISIEDHDAKPAPVLACSSYSPSVSPDEKCMAYVQDGALRITDLVKQSRLAEWAMCMPMWGGNWSPNGREFAFGGTSQYVEARAGLWIYDVEQREAKNVLTGQIISAAWSCDKRQMLLSLGPPYFELWVADLDPNLSTADALGPARDVNETLLEWIEVSNRESEIDPNQLLIQWERTASALWIDDDRAPTYLEEMSRAIDRLPDQIGICHWSAKGTFARPEVNKRVFPLTLLLVNKVVEKEPKYARDFAFDLYNAGQHEEAARLWQISEAAAPDGSCHYDEESDTYTILGFGTDIWGRFDDFHFVYKELHGDGSIAARIGSIENVQEWTKAGVMIRATLEPDSPNAMVLATPSGIVSFQYRPKAFEITKQMDMPLDRIQLPHWVRLTRQGNRFTAQHATDNVNWQDVEDPSGRPATVEIPMGPTVYIGLAANSRDVTRTAEARISHVTTTGSISPAGPFTESQDIPSQSPSVPDAPGNSN